MERHSFDTVSFVFGVLFAAVGVLFTVATEPWDLLTGLSLGWVWAVALIAVGVALLVPALRRTRPEGPDQTEDLSGALEELGPPPID